MRQKAVNQVDALVERRLKVFTIFATPCLHRPVVLIGFERHEHASHGLVGILFGFFGNPLEFKLASESGFCGALWLVEATVRSDGACFDVVFHAGFQNADCFPPTFFVQDWHQQFDSSIKVSRHHVGTRNQHLIVTTMSEMEQSRMFEKAIDDADYFNIFAQSRYARAKAADASNV